jgi:hypothetical protein
MASKSATQRSARQPRAMRLQPGQQPCAADPAVTKTTEASRNSELQVSGQTLSVTVAIPLLRTVSAPLLPPPSVPVRAPRRPRARHARTHSGRRRPENEPRTASALVTGTSLGQERRAVKPSAQPQFQELKGIAAAWLVAGLCWWRGCRVVVSGVVTVMVQWMRCGSGWGLPFLDGQARCGSARARAQVRDLPRAFRTAYLRLIYAADCCSRYSSWTCRGLRY